jgi:uncharacterized protein (TIRG00374 family)
MIVWSLLGGGAIAVAASSIMLTFFVLKKSLPPWLPQKVQQIIHAFHTGMWPRAREVVPIAVLTLLIWTLEVLWIFLLARGFGLKLSLAEAIFLTMLPLLATAFPFTPSGAGVVELTLFSCLRAVGVSSPAAASLTIVNRFLDHWLHIGLGLVIWAISRGIGLRTWREAPLEDAPGAASPDTSLSPEVIHAG